MNIQSSHHQTLILIRGLPGSGKSTLAQRLVSNIPWSVSAEADAFFLDSEGNYSYNPTMVKAAHEWCQCKCHDKLRQGHTVIVSNTFTQLWEMQPYLDMAKELNLPVQVIECKGNFGSIHNVPEEAIAKMKARWEQYNG
jgi:predicted kinase